MKKGKPRSEHCPGIDLNACLESSILESRVELETAEIWAHSGSLSRYSTLFPGSWGCSRAERPFRTGPLSRGHRNLNCRHTYESTLTKAESIL